ncbi:MAG: hypothetical protein RR851_02700 [Clostridium sp.]
MAYVKTIWKDRIVQNPRTYTKTDNADGSLTLTPKAGLITEEGTPISAANMNKIEQGIEDANTQLGDIKTVELPNKLNISDTTPIATSGVASAYTITVTNPNLSEYTIVPHINNAINTTISLNGGTAINIKNREGTNVEADVLKANIPTKIVRVGNSFFIASGGTSDDDVSIKIIKRIPNSPQIDNLIYDKVTDTIVCYNGTFLYKIDCKTGTTLLTLAIDFIYNVLRFDEYNRTINYGGGYIIDYDTFKSVTGKRDLRFRDTDSSNKECTVIDYTTGILYSYNSAFNEMVISAINIDKTIIYRRDLTSILGNDKSPYSIAVSKDYIFVYARNTQSIIRLLKTDGSIHGYMQTPFTSTSKIFIRSSPKNNFLYIWTNTGENMRCWNGTQFIVVPSSGKGFTVSGDGVLLTADMFAINDSTLTLVTWDETITICKPIPTPIVNRINVALDYFISINNDTFYTFIQANNTKSMIRVKTKLLK